MSVDQDKCCGAGTCVPLAPDPHETVRGAVGACPGLAIADAS